METTPADPNTRNPQTRSHCAPFDRNFAFTHVGRSFDGLNFAKNTKTSNVTLLAARPTEGSFQLRGWNELDVDLFYAAYTKLIAGKRTQQEFRILGMHYHDGEEP